jgi:16S rRNA (guanine966-N2)-methyltransferase
MRIIAGRFKRRVLSSPSGSETRPTTDRAREAIFNLLQARMELEGCRVLDLFSGTGALGLEALSRGADRLVCVDQSAACIRTAKANAASLDPNLNVDFLQTDVFRWLKSQNPGQYELILADPPYDVEGLETLPDYVIPLLSPEGLFVLEHDRKKNFEGRPDWITTRKYGKSAVSLFSHPSTQ